MDEIKPCPFCGGEGKIIVRKGKDGWRDRYSVLCDYEDGGCMICKRVYKPVRPLPCVRDEHGEIRGQTVKQLFAKINGELDELKETILFFAEVGMKAKAINAKDELRQVDREDIAEEAADTITAITTMLESLGIDAEMRDEAQRRVNEKNRERGRL